MLVQEYQMLMAESEASIKPSGDHMPEDLESSPANVVESIETEKPLLKLS